MKILFLVAIWSALTLQIYSQAKPQALKFDEFDTFSEANYYPPEDFSFADRIARFVSRMKIERGKKAFIIYYRARRTPESERYMIHNWADKTKWEIREKTRTRAEDVVVIDGGFREKATLEYWIVPKAADDPKPTPTFPASEAALCPQLSVDYDYAMYNRYKEISFAASAYSYSGSGYRWTVSSGKIVEGQGSARIRIELADTDLKRVTAFVEFAGLPPDCESAASATVEIAVQPYLLDSAPRFNYSDLAARTDNFLISVRNDPSARGYMIVYAGRRGGTWQRDYAILSVMQVFAFLSLDTSLVTIVKGGFRDYNTVEFWMVPEGTQPPKPTPSVDAAFITPPGKRRKKGKQ
jgi:hypothetical protein